MGLLCDLGLAWKSLRLVGGPSGAWSSALGLPFPAHQMGWLEGPPGEAVPGPAPWNSPPGWSRDRPVSPLPRGRGAPGRALPPELAVLALPQFPPKQGEGSGRALGEKLTAEGLRRPGQSARARDASQGLGTRAEIPGGGPHLRALPWPPSSLTRSLGHPLRVLCSPSVVLAPCGWPLAPWGTWGPLLPRGAPLLSPVPSGLPAWPLPLPACLPATVSLPFSLSLSPCPCPSLGL